MWITSRFVALASLTWIASGANTYNQAVDDNYVAPYRCPGKYDENSPWFPDVSDCMCYMVCDTYGGAVRMCCPEGLWWDDEERTCRMTTDFPQIHREKCFALTRGLGTTRQLKDIFLGRCWEYQRYINPDAFNNGYKECGQLFDYFAKSFVNQGACGDVEPSAYDELIQAAAIELPPSKQIFWSGVYSLAQTYANRGHRCFTLESTLIGYLLNDVTWCGQKEAPGINFDSCPAFASCSNHVMASFWSAALENYAKQAQGEVIVMLNGSRVDGAAFRNNSFFAEHELPHLDSSIVTKLKIWVIHDLDRPVTETCRKGSLKELELLAGERGFNYECYDNPPEILHYLCVDFAQHPLCNFFHGQRL